MARMNFTGIDFVAEPDFPDVEWALYGIVDVRCHISIYALVIGIYDYLGDKHILMPDELISELAHGHGTPRDTYY